MKRQFETDDGTLVLVESKLKACGVQGNEVKARRASSQKKRNSKKKELFKRSAVTSGFRSSTDLVLDAVELEGYFPYSMGGTNGAPRLDGVISKREVRLARGM